MNTLAIRTWTTTCTLPSLPLDLRITKNNNRNSLTTSPNLEFDNVKTSELGCCQNSPVTGKADVRFHDMARHFEDPIKQAGINVHLTIRYLTGQGWLRRHKQSRKRQSSRTCRNTMSNRSLWMTLTKHKRYRFTQHNKTICCSNREQQNESWNRNHRRNGNGSKSTYIQRGSRRRMC